jgi:hypothetical protein
MIGIVGGKEKKHRVESYEEKLMYSCGVIDKSPKEEEIAELSNLLTQPPRYINISNERYDCFYSILRRVIILYPFKPAIPALWFSLINPSLSDLIPKLRTSADTAGIRRKLKTYLST